ncbi:MAG: hypothetical protein QGI55_07565 [Pseudomonadales bacterium]|nr:hypothetical protein [Pseudomonadales bacterium]
MSWMEDDPNHILMQIAREDRIYPTVYRLNIYNNRLSRVRRHRETVFNWYADGKDELRLATGYKQLQPVALRFDDGRLRNVDISHLAGLGPPPAPVAILKRGNEAIVSANNGKNTRGLYRVNIVGFHGRFSLIIGVG